MVSAGDIRNGLTIEYDGNVYQVIEFQHVKPGREQLSLEQSLKISQVVVLLKSLSDLQKSSHRLV